MRHIQEIQLQQPFDLQLFSSFSQKEGTVIFHTGSHEIPTECWTIIGIQPKKKIITWDEIQTMLNYKKNSVDTFNFPLQSGLLGYFAYPNVHLTNSIPNMLFYAFDSFLLYNHCTQKTYITFSESSDIQRWKSILKNVSDTKEQYKTMGILEKSVNKLQYIDKIKTIKNLLAAGEVYQINYAIRFQKAFEGDPYALFLQLNRSNPTHFSAYLHCGDFHIISSSPERFFKVKNRKIITQPIKGTIGKKGGKEALQYLLESEKERAELDMITDLERNDVGKICQYGSLQVTKNRSLLEMPNLWHTYSQVEGMLEPKITQQDIIQAMFPGGSITGCPKKRAMEYIEQLEKMPRNIYTGSIGYMNPHGDIDFNIAIRTILIQDGMLEFWAGGGIVADSDPEKEYEECLLKAEKFLEL